MLSTLSGRTGSVSVVGHSSAEIVCFTESVCFVLLLPGTLVPIFSLSALIFFATFRGFEQPSREDYQMMYTVILLEVVLTNLLLFSCLRDCSLFVLLSIAELKDASLENRGKRGANFEVNGQFFGQKRLHRK